MAWLGLIPESGVKLGMNTNSMMLKKNIFKNYTLLILKMSMGEVLQGFIKPMNVSFWEGMYSTQPDRCSMVSSEGSCAAYYNYKYPSQEILTS